MSGGSFDYLYMRPEAQADAYEPLAVILEQEGHLDAAAAVREIARHKQAGEAAHKKAENLLHAVEWYRSGDWGPDQVREVVAEWRVDNHT